MKKFLSFALKPQWKLIAVILVLAILQVGFQIQIINIFSDALYDVESLNVVSLLGDGIIMIVLTILSIAVIYALFYFSNIVSSNAAYLTREKIFHILMNLPDEEIEKFKITGLITRSTRGIYSEEGFITYFLKNFLIVPFVFIAVVIEIALIDWVFACVFAAFIIILGIILVFKIKRVTALFFKAKKTYGKLNTLFFSKISNLASNTPFKKDEAREEFKKACNVSYDKNINYLLSQYYVGPVILLILNIAVALLLVFIIFGVPIGFSSQTAVDSVVILQYILYFLTTLVVVPTLIELWPRSYATSVRIEEVLNLEDKIVKKQNTSKIIEIDGEDIEGGYEAILADRMEIIKKFNMILGRYKFKVFVSLILVAISGLCIVYAPKVVGNIFNMLSLDPNSIRDYNILINICLLFVLYFVGYLFKLPSNRFMVYIGEEIAYNLRMQLFEKLDFVDSGFIKSDAKGKVLSRLNNDLMNVREFVSLHLSEIFAQFLLILFVIIMMLATDLRLAMIYIVTLPVYVLCFYLSDSMSRDSYDLHQKHLARMMSYFERSIVNRSPIHEKNFEKINKTVNRYFLKSRNISNFVLPATTFVTNFSNIAVYITGVFFLMTDQIQLGTLLSIIIYGQLMNKPIKKISASIVFLETSFASIKRIFAIIDFKDRN